jgi:hypothetical protein
MPTALLQNKTPPKLPRPSGFFLTLVLHDQRESTMSCEENNKIPNFSKNYILYSTERNG